MNGIEYLADTNAVLYFLSGNECMKPYISKKFAVSVISEMELLSFRRLTAEDETSIRRFLDGCLSLGISEDVKNTTISLRKQFSIKLPDAIIAATASVNGLCLITADVGFLKLKDKVKLDIVKPMFT